MPKNDSPSLVCPDCGRYPFQLVPHDCPARATPPVSEPDATLRTALEESIKLQSHYARLLNMYDGGDRLSFPNAEAWIRRLVECGKLPPLSAKGS